MLKPARGACDALLPFALFSLWGARRQDDTHHDLDKEETVG